MKESKDKTQIIQCRPVGYFWLAGIFGAFCLMVGFAYVFESPQNHEKSDLFAFIGLLAITGVPTLIFGALSWRSGIVATESGLRWRYGRQWKSATWNEVQDFYEETRAWTGQHFVVKTKAGDFAFNAAYSRVLKLKDFIAQNARQAKTREWSKLGLRAMDKEPQVFRYGDGENWFFGGLYPLFFGVPAFMPFYALLTGSAAFREWILALLQLPLGLMLIGVGGGFLLWLCMVIAFFFFFNWARENWERGHETIEVTPEGILWKKGEQNIMASWDEINEFHKTRRPLQHSLYWLETVHGGIDFSRAISRFGFLLELIRHHALHLKVREKLAAEYTLGDEKLKWSGKQIGEGARVFHYRTSINRALLWLPSTLSFLPLVPPVVRQVDLERTGDDPGTFLWFYGISMLIISVVGWLHYYRSSLHVTEADLEQIHLFKRKFIAWSDIQELEKKPDGGYFVKGENTTIAVKSFIPADWEELKETIAQRAINADGWQGTQNRSSGNEIAKHRQS